ncbi:MAG: hypothetical protein HY644_10720 [Acidobacteria bacterium]|nr:hypothetical protein [Acidobacteriota bacterium]
MSRMRLTPFSFLLGLTVASTLGQQRPLVSEIPEPVSDGKVRLELGVDFFKDQPFPLTGLQGDLVHLGVIGGRVGLGSHVEFQVQGTIGNFLNINRRGPAPFAERLRISENSTSDIGDFLFATKISLYKEAHSLPSVSFRVGAILPNLSTDSGLGINTTRTFGSLLVGKHLGKSYLFSNLGIMLIDNPADLASQSDKFTYGVAFMHPLRGPITLLGEIQGMHGDRHPGTEDALQLRLGAQIRAAGLTWDIAALAGLRKTDPDSGIVFGITRDFQLFKLSRKP